MTLQIVTATSGSVLLLALCTTSTKCVCSDRRCEAGKLALLISTLNLPLGSWASWRCPPPHAASKSAPQISPMLLVLTAGRT